MRYASAAAAFLPAVLAAPYGGPPQACPWGPPGPHGPPGPGGPGPHIGNPTAYFLDDSPAGSSIVALTIGSDGCVSDPIRTSTGGVGAIAVNGTGFPNAKDPLASQDSVVVSGNLLFSVNAGSNTLAAFGINPFDPQHPIMIGSPVNTLGEFPVSVTYSEALNTVCVLNGGAKAGVACFTVHPFLGLKQLGPLRSIGQALNQTTPPTTPPLSASEIIFAPDSSAVYAITKGEAGVTPVKPGWIAAFAVENGVVSSKAVLTSYANVPMAFGSVFLDNSRLFVSDPSFGGAILDFSSNMSASVVASATVPGQGAICWAAYAPGLNTAYLIDAGKNSIYSVDAQTGALGATINVTTSSAGPGLFDSAVLNNKLYSLGGAPGIAVVDLEKGEQVQWFDLSGLGDRSGFTGMALYP